MQPAIEIRSILAASALTEESDDVIASAAALAEAAGAELHLVHALEDPVLPYRHLTQYAMEDQKLAADARVALREQVARLAGRARVASEAVQRGRADDVILARAREVAADLVLIGPHRRSWRDYAGLGGTADHLVRRLEIACIVVRGPLRVPLERVMVALDLAEPAPATLDVTLRLVLATGAPVSPVAENPARVRVVHVLPASLNFAGSPLERSALQTYLTREVDAALERLPEARGLDLHSDVMLGHGAPAEDILRHVAAGGFDLVALATHGHGLFDRAIVGSVALAVTSRAECSVLLAPPALWQAQREAAEVASAAASPAPTTSHPTPRPL